MTPAPLPAPRRRVSARSRRVSAAAELAVIAVRVSTTEQGESGAGLAAQQAACEALAAREGLRVVAVLTDVCSGTVAPAARDGMGEALAMLADGRAGVLLAGKVDRLTRRQTDLFGLMDQAHRAGWRIRTADGSLDTGSANGRLMAAVAGLFAELERDLISSRTRDALATRKAAGVRLGGPVSTPEAVRERIRSLLLSGHTQAAVAAALNRDGITTATGCEWTQPNVRRVAASLRLDDAATLPGPVPRHLRTA